MNIIETIALATNIVRLIYNKYVEFKSITKVENYLIINKINTKNGIDFQRYSLRFILGNPVYAIADKNIYDYGDAPSSYGTAFHLYKKTPKLKLGTFIDYSTGSVNNSYATADDKQNTGEINDEENGEHESWNRVKHEEQEACDVVKS